MEIFHIRVVFQNINLKKWNCEKGGRSSMETMCKDPLFGVMQYKHRWVKKQVISAFGKEWEVTIAAKAYLGKPITKEQQLAYARFSEREVEEISNVEQMIIAYVNDNIKELSIGWIGARKVNSIDELSQMVVPRTLLFKQDGTTIFLLDCVWDVESGLAVKIYPDKRIGSQDLFL
jgi:hypothetical protein